jgi:hypothetical protein
MDDTKMWMVIVSIMGVAAGLYIASTLKPLNNYVFFLAIFALIGVAVANTVLLVIYEVYKWLNSSSKTQNDNL